jgi:hypothetical protein
MNEESSSPSESQFLVYKALSTARPRPVDTDFEEAIKRLPQAPVAKKPKVGTKG